MAFHVPESYRLTSGLMASSTIDGNNGVFILPQGGFYFQCVASDGMEWEHVSVTLRFKSSTNYNLPSWEEMCYIKSVFWDDEDVVVQYHPAKSQYVNNHPFVLHLWRPTTVLLPVPESIMVGIKD